MARLTQDWWTNEWCWGGATLEDVLREVAAMKAAGDRRMFDSTPMFGHRANLPFVAELTELRRYPGRAGMEALLRRCGWQSDGHLWTCPIHVVTPQEDVSAARKRTLAPT